MAAAFFREEFDRSFLTAIVEDVDGYVHNAIRGHLLALPATCGVPVFSYAHEQLLSIVYSNRAESLAIIRRGIERGELDKVALLNVKRNCDRKVPDFSLETLELYVYRDDTHTIRVLEDGKYALSVRCFNIEHLTATECDNSVYVSYDSLEDALRAIGMEIRRVDKRERARAAHSLDAL